MHLLLLGSLGLLFREGLRGARVGIEVLGHFLELGLGLFEELGAVVEFAVELDGRGGVVEAGHLEELVVVVGVA